MRAIKYLSTLSFVATLFPSSFASLKHTNSEAFVQLADLTRPSNERQAHKNHPHDFRHKSSKSLSYQEEGVDWRLTPNGQSRFLSTGQHNSAAFNIAPIDDTQHESDASLYPSDQEVDSEARHSLHHDEDSTSKTFAVNTSPLNPPSIPLAVKSPYLNIWSPSGSLLSATPPNHAGNGGYLAGQFPSFWTSGYGADGEYRVGWGGFIRVDNITYQWMGDNFGSVVRAGKNAQQLGVSYTATRSIFQFEADGVRFNVTFMTPVWPHDYLRQSIPMSYLHFELDRTSAGGRSVQLFTDIDERWSTAHDYDYQEFPSNMQWVDNVRSNGKNSSIYFVQRTNPQVYTEFRQRAEWGSATYAMRKRPGMSSRNNNNVVAQLEFLNHGSVSYDHNPVAGPDNSFSYSVNFDGKGGDDALFGIGHIRSPYVNYIKASNKTRNGTDVPTSYLQDRYGYWMSKYPNFSDLVAFFMSDFENALSHCKKLDAQIDRDSRAAVGGGQIGEKYSAITQLSVRQSFATLEITVSYDEKAKKYNTSDAIIFLKEISSNGDMQTVDVFAPQFPLLTYLNPDLLRDIMKPIFEYTESGLYPNKWCVHDLGVYPSAFGHNDGKDEPMQVEESGNMILLALHYAQLVGKEKALKFLKPHYKIMQQWTEFLISDSLIPALQLSTDDFAGTLANQSNLAIKGIQGIAAMGEIATYLGHDKQAANYRNVSQTYIQAFYGYAINQNNTHVKLAYQNENSWGTLYNLVFDRLLNLRLVAEEIYQKQDAFYPTKANKYGTPLDSRFSWAKSDWQMWASATAANRTTRDFWIEHLYRFLSDRKTDAPFTDLFETFTGDFPKLPRTPQIYFIARPVVGGHLMHLAMEKANKANNVTQYTYGPPISSRKHIAQQDALHRIISSQDTETFVAEANEIQSSFSVNDMENLSDTSVESTNDGISNVAMAKDDSLPSQHLFRTVKIHAQRF